MKMKFSAMALSTALLASSVASAAGLEFDPKFYVGGEGQVATTTAGLKEVKIGNDLTIKRTDNKSLLGKSGGLGGTIFAGTRLNEYMGAEAGYTFMSSPKNAFSSLNNFNVSNIKTKMSNAYIDALGYLPVCQELDLIGSVGVGFLSTRVSGNYEGTGINAGTSGKFSESQTKAGVRVGAGVGYKFDENLGARLMVRYQQGNKHIKSVTSAGLGLTYQF